jgi:hypothetical protein
MSVLRSSVVTGTRRGLKAAAELLVIMIPISLAVAVLDWAGFLDKAAAFISPLFKYFGLPGSAAFAFIAGVLLNCYSALAVMATLPLTGREITILSVMILLAHNLPVEVSVQKKAGSSFLGIFFLRLLCGLAAGAALNLLMPGSGTAGAVLSAPAAGFSVPFTAMLGNWALDTLGWIIKILLIIMGLMIMNQFLEESGAIRVIGRFVGPVIRFMGLPPSAAFLWLVMNLLGLAYGAGVLLGQRKEGRISDTDMRLLNVSAALCHSLLEDTLLFVAIGASAGWVVFSRVLLASAAVWFYRLFILRKRAA